MKTKMYLLGFTVLLGLFSLSSTKSYAVPECDCTIDNPACEASLCGKNNDKIEVCHQPTANENQNENAKGPESRPDAMTLCVSETAAQNHIKNHGDECGACDVED